VTSITIAAGTSVNIPISSINRSSTFWGPDANEWKPERWLNDLQGVPAGAKELPGYHHILTFSEGPRMCLGKGFAVTEIKAWFLCKT
jgi:cytochrome P450